MQSTQRPTRRKTTRHLFEDEDEPPAKRSKLDANNAVNGTTKQANGKAAIPKPKKAKRAYDEDADGFQFTRKTRSTQVQNEPAPVPAADPSNSRSCTTTGTKKKKDSLLHSGSSEPEPGQRRRRSARLSGENEPVHDQARVAKSKRPRKSDEHEDHASKISRSSNHVASNSNQHKTSAQDRDGSPELVPGEMHVEKSRDGTKIALPFADTPIIRRNKEMRQQTKSKHRRSSTGLRGRRASSLIESGTSNAVPHADVAILDFYKHIEQSLPEPRRMKQLLTWCGTRALPEKAHGGTGDASEMLAKDSARHISEELLKDFANKPEMSDWFSREDTVDVDDASVVKKPNPRNQRNAEKLNELEAEIERLQEEKKSWERLLSNKLPPSPEIESSDPATINAALLDPSQAAILETLRSTTIATSSIPTKSSQNEANPAPPSNDTSTRLNSVVNSLEPNIDMFADGIHKISQYRLAAERVADRILSATAEKLEERDREAREASGTRGVSAKDVLSALGGALSERVR